MRQVRLAVIQDHVLEGDGNLLAFGVDFSTPNRGASWTELIFWSITTANALDLVTGIGFFGMKVFIALRGLHRFIGRGGLAAMKQINDSILSDDIWLGFSASSGHQNSG